MKKNKKTRDIGFYVLILVVLVAVIFLMLSNNETESMSYTEVRSLFENEQVKSFTVDGDTLYLSLKEPVSGRYTLTHTLYSFNVFYEDMHELIDQQWHDGIITEYNYDVGWTMPWWLSFLPYLLIMIVFGVLWFVMMNKGVGGDKLGVDHRGPHLAAEQTEADVGDVLHRSEENGAVAQIYVADLHSGLFGG